MVEFHSYQMVQQTDTESIFGDYHRRANNCSRCIYESSNSYILYSRYFRVGWDYLINIETSDSNIVCEFYRLIKGSWLLSKAWKIYQSTYNQIYSKYVVLFDNEMPKPRKRWLGAVWWIEENSFCFWLISAQPQNYHPMISRTISQYVCTANNLQTNYALK